MSRLSKEERESLRKSGSWPHVGTDLFVAVEAILAAHDAERDALAARLEKVTALAAEWEDEGGLGAAGLLTDLAHDLRRALAVPGQHEEGEET